jgi:hypothetical protein
MLGDLLWLCESRGFAPPWESLRLEQLESARLASYAARMGLDLGHQDRPCRGRQWLP